MFRIVGTMMLGASLVAAAPLQRPATPETSPMLKRTIILEHEESICKATVLSNQAIAEGLFAAGSGTLSSVCECASMLTVAALPQDAVMAYGKQGFDPGPIEAAAKRNMQRCIRAPMAPAASP